ncbi:MAG: putative TonB-dependent receptor [Caulobacteraceae bacterium]|nr:putative TonB-dependent receptor [Caulobacteraceae bacterium]
MLANLTAEYRVTDAISVNAGGRNLTDQNYQLVDGFPQSGRSVSFGVRARY